MTHLRRFFCLGLTALLAAHSMAASAQSPVTALPIDDDSRNTGTRERVRIGSSRGAVLLLLGRPDACAGDDHWIFWGFRTHPGSANPKGYDALVLSFTGEIVTGMKLADARAIRLFLAQQGLPLGE